MNGDRVLTTRLRGNHKTRAKVRSARQPLHETNKAMIVKNTPLENEFFWLPVDQGREGLCDAEWMRAGMKSLL